MIREARLLFLVALTYTIYAVSIYLDQGGFIFPYVVNEAVLLVVAIQFAFKNRTQRFAAVNIVLIGAFAVLMNTRYWEMVLSHENIVSFAESLWTDVFGVFFGIAVVIFGVSTAVRQKSALGLTMVTFFVFLITIALANNSALFYALAYLVMTISTYVRPAYAPLHLFWGLLLILELAELATFFLNTGSL